MTALCQVCKTPMDDEDRREGAIWGPRIVNDPVEGEVMAWGYTCNACAAQEPDHWKQVMKDRQTFLKNCLTAFMRHPTERAAAAYRHQLESYRDMWEGVKRVTHG